MQEKEIEFFSKSENQKAPQLNPDEKFYIIYSPMKFKLRPCESIMSNLQLKIKLPDNVQGIIGLLSSLILQKLTIENFKRLTSETNDELIKLGLLKRDFHDTIKVKKNQEMAGLILLHKDNI